MKQTEFLDLNSGCCTVVQTGGQKPRQPQKTKSCTNTHIACRATQDKGTRKNEQGQLLLNNIHQFMHLEQLPSPKGECYHCGIHLVIMTASRESTTLGFYHQINSLSGKSLTAAFVSASPLIFMPRSDRFGLMFTSSGILQEQSQEKVPCLPIHGDHLSK